MKILTNFSVLAVIGELYRVIENRFRRSVLPAWCFFVVGFLTALLPTQQLHASHAMGADISYTCIDSNINQYQISITFYRDCDGIAAPDPVTVDYGSASCNFSSSITLSGGAGVEVSPLCPDQANASTCNGGNLPGVEEYTYTGIVTLPFDCPDWTFSFAECCRNDQITNSNNASSFDLYVESSLDNLNVPCNSSPTFTSLPTPYICVGQTISYNHGAVDADGDQLIYTLVDPLDDATNTVPFAPNYSASYPISTASGTFGFDSLSGQMTFTPDILQVGILTVLVEEYRDGVLIGSTMRDIQVVVLNCSNGAPDVGGIDNTVGAATVDSVTIQTCPGSPVSFDIDVTDPDGDTLTMSSNVDVAIPAATFDVLGSGSALTGTFNWAIPVQDTGLFTFTITIADDGCPIAGTQVVAINIIVSDELISGEDTFVYCGVPVELQAYGVNVQWTPSTGLDCDTCQTPLAEPSVSTMYYVSSDCGDDSVYVTVAPPFDLSVPNDTSICLNGATTIGTTPSIPGNYTYEWFPASSLNASDVQFPIASPQNSTNYRVTVTSEFGCERDTNMRVFLAGEAPDVTIFADRTEMCPGDTANLDASPPPSTCNEYEVSTIPHAPLSAGGTQVILSDDAISSPLPIGFNFTFFCIDYTQFYIGSNGFITFDAGSPSGCCSGQQIPDGAAPNNIIAFAWEDLNPSAGGSVTYTTVGTAPNRTLVVRFDGVEHFGGAESVTAEVHLKETSNDIEIHLTQMTSDGGNHTLGIENNDGSIGYAPAGYVATNWSATNEAFRFNIVTPPTLVFQWTPTAGLSDPASATPMAFPDQTTTYTVLVRDSICEATEFITINIDTLQIEAFQDTIVCSANPIPIRVETNVYIDTTLPPPVVVCDSYLVASIPYAALNGTRTPVPLTDDQVSGAQQIGFGFDFFCNTQTRLFIAANGFITFDLISLGSVNPQTIPDPAIDNNLIAIAWSDLNPSVGGTVSHFTTGVAPNRVFVVEYDNIPHFGSSSVVSAQIQLFESSNVVEIHATNIQNDGGTMTMGVEGPGGVRGFAPPGKNNGIWTATTQAWRFTQGTVGPPPHSVTVNWSPGISLDDSTAQSTIARPFGTTQYIVEVANNICSLRDTVTVLFDNLSFDASADVSDLSCFGTNDGSIEITTLGGQPPFSYFLDSLPPVTSPIFDSLPAGTYQVRIADLSGCDTTILATISEPPALGMTLVQIDSPTCSGFDDGIIEVLGNGGTSPLLYDANNGTPQVSPVFDSLPPGLYDIRVTDSLGCDTTISLALFMNTTLRLNTTDKQNVSCFGDSSGSLTIGGNGGVRPYTYSLDNVTFQNDSVFSGLPAGNYVVYVRDNDSCFAIHADTITEPTHLTASAIFDSITCFNGNDGTIQASASGGTLPHQFSIDSVNFNSTGLFDSLFAGTYTVYIIDDNGCDTSLSVEMYEPLAGILASLQLDSTTCFAADDAQITVSASGGTTPYTYTMGPTTQNQPVFANLPPATYIVRSTDANGCFTLDTSIVVEPAQIVPIVDTTGVSCFGNTDGNAVITVVSGGVRPFNYALANNPAQTDSVFNNLRPGQYQVTVTDADLCSNTVDFVISEPQPLIASATSSDVICNGANDGELNVSVNAGSPPYQYSYDGVNFQDSSRFNNLSPGTYSVTIRDANGCSFNSNQVIIAEPSAVLATNVVSDAVCFGYDDGSAAISAFGGTPPYSFSISEDGVNFNSKGPVPNETTFDSLGAAVYSYLVVDDNGCPLSGVFEINQPEPIGVLPMSFNTSCFGPEYEDGSVLVDVVIEPDRLPLVYTLDGVTDQFSRFFDSIPAGTHTMTVTDINGCFESQNFDISQPPPLIVTIQPDSPFVVLGGSTQLVTELNLSGNFNYVWSPSDGLSCDDCPSPVATPYETTEYTLLVEDISDPAFPCYTSATTTLSVFEQIGEFVPNVFTPNGDGINDEFQIVGENIKSVELIVYNRWGEKVFESVSQLDGWDGTFKGEKARNGVYVYLAKVTFLNSRERRFKGSITLIR